MRTDRRRISILIAVCMVLLCAGFLGRTVFRNKASQSADESAAKAEREFDVDSILAQYKANASRFATLRVTWRETQQYLPPWFSINEKQAAALERQAAEGGVNATDKTSLLKQAEQFRNANKYNREISHRDFDFWSDGRAYQVRIPRSASKSTESPHFADDPITPETLTKAYSSTCIFSWSPAQAGSLRTWWGIDSRDGTGQASISDASVGQAIVNFQFPPLGLRDPSWGEESHLRPVDQFFSGASSDFQIVRSEFLQGTKTVVVDRVKIRAAPEGMDEHGGKLELMECMRAWLDPERGFLPLRLESRGGWRLNGKPLGNPETWKPNSALELLEIANVSGAFYPKHYTLTSYCADPALNQNPNDIAGLIAGTAQELITVPYERTTWAASAVEPGRSMPPSMFVPRFPDNANVADVTARKRTAPLQPLKALKTGDTAPEWKVAGWTDGRARKLSDFRGKVVLLDFWGVWCSPCMQGLPAIELVRKKYGDAVVCLEIHTAGADISKVRDVLAAKGVSSPSAIDEGVDREGATGNLYGVDAWPHMVLIDGDGKIAWSSHDKTNDALMESAARAAGFGWPPKEMSDSELHQLHLMAFSILIDKTRGGPAEVQTK